MVPSEILTMASIGDARKTSNGCDVAKRVPRKQSGFRVPSGNVAAIDFGTTNCSVAYTTVGSGLEEGPRRLPLNTTYHRVPTAVLFKPDGTIDSFGYDARAQYLNLDDAERLECAYFEQIKMNLQHDENVNREMKIRAKNGTEYYLVDVIAQILKYLKIQLIEKHLQRGGHPLEATNFDWVITVPAIWKARGKQMMREAGYKAGLCSKYSCGQLKMASAQWMPVIPEEEAPEKLSLALEPEAAAIYCQNLRAEQVASYCQSVQPFTSTSYLVVDIGGGTVDISAHRLSSSPDKHVEVILPPAGNDCGGSMVNKKFTEFLEELVDDNMFTRYIDTGDETLNATHKARLNELVNDTFERQKRIFGEKGGEGSKLSIRLPYTFREIYQSKLIAGIRKLNDPHIQLSGIDLRIAYPKMKEFFQPVVEGLLQCMTETLLSLDEEVETIYIVGGFGGCQYIYNAITKEFGDSYKYITPAEHDFAVVHGAVLFRQIPNTVCARRADATYGVRVNIPFEEGKHEQDYKWVNAKGEYQCENIFSTFVERGDIVSTSEVLLRDYFPARPNQERMHIDIYSSSEKDVWYTTGRMPKGMNAASPLADVQKIGELIVPFPKEGCEEGAQGVSEPLNSQRKVEVTFDFSHTEIQVKGYDKLANTEVKVVLDFLSS